MATIGYVRKNGEGFTGTLKTLSINAPIEIRHNASPASDKAPDYLVYSGNVELGAGFTRTGRTSGKEYVSIKLEAPEFGTIWANLGRAAGQDDDDTFALIWNPN
ncbi:MAG: DUF736 domain-containing protein [Parvibaculum sp.]